MKRDIHVRGRDGSTVTKSIKLPNLCPHCGQTMTPNVLSTNSYDTTRESPMSFGVFVNCTANNCGKYFAIQYTSDYNGSYLLPYTYKPPVSVDLPENIDKVSPDFVEIYSQATKAEAEGLHQIAGVGYRKALEFLIKDYAIYSNGEDADDIKKMFLGKVIDKYLDDFPKLQNLAKAASWIGNDETHYVRRHDDKDIRDMKQFIKSASHFIIANYDADLAENFISEEN